MKTKLALVLVLGWCSGGCSETEHFAVGTKAYYAAPNECSIVDNAAGAVVLVADHDRATKGMGLVFEGVTPGNAWIDCGDHYSSKIEVHEVARVELRIEATGPVAVGDSAPQVCLMAFDKAGTELKLGLLVEGVEFQFSDHVERVGGCMELHTNYACSSSQTAKKEGTATVTATWRGHSATTRFEVRGTRDP